MCIRIYIFLFQTKKKNTYTNKKEKKLKKIEKQKKPKIRRKRKMLLLFTISVENLTIYDDIVWKFAMGTFNLRDQSKKIEHYTLEKKQQTLENIGLCLFTLCSRWKPRYVNAVKTSLSTYSIHPSSPTFNIKMIEICILQIITSTLSKALPWISQKVVYNSHMFFKMC